MTEQEITCDNCEHAFRIDENEDEERIRCPECDTVLDQPTATSENDAEESDVPPVTGSNPIEDESTTPNRSRGEESGGSRSDDSRVASNDPSTSDSGTASSRFSVTNVISTSFELFFGDFASFVGLGVIILSPMIVINLLMLLPGFGQAAVTVSLFSNMVGGLVLTPLLSGAMMYGVIRKLNNKSFEMSDCISEAVSMLLPLIGLSILQGIIVGVGVVLCLIPGIIAAMMLYVSIPVLMIENTGVIDALKRSYELTSDNLLRIFGIIAILFVINFTLGLVTGLATVGLGANQTTNSVLNTGLSVLTHTLSSITIATTYYFLRLKKEGTTLDEMVLLFD